MRNYLKKAAAISLNLLLWMCGAFFLLGGATYFEKSISAAISMLLLGLILLPPVWKIVRHIRPQHLSGKFRASLAVILLVTAFSTSPTSSQPSEQYSAAEPVVVSTAVSSGEKKAPEPISQKENIIGIVYLDRNYVLKGAGVANEKYLLQFSNGTSTEAKADNNGKYTVNVPESAGVFGYVELVRDTNGFWPGGKQTYERGYFALTDDNPLFSNDTLKPILLGLGGSSPYEMSGYFFRGVSLVLKSGDNVLATTKVDNMGRYRFENISLDTNYSPISIYEKVSTGWFSSKENRLVEGKYLDMKSNQILAAIPTITKEETRKVAVPFESRSVDSGTLPRGETKITQDGGDGEKTIVYRVTYKGDDEVDRKIISESITKQSVERITTVGTYVTPPIYVAPPTQTSVYYRNCSAARAAGAAPVYKGDPGYGSHLDKDRDGVGCE